MVASLTPLPVIGVPVASQSLKGLDSLLSIVQMPGGVPVATGVFRAHMEVELVNDGPATFILESREEA